MGKLVSQLKEKLLPGMHIPEPLELLYSWIEGNGLYEDNDECFFRVGNEPARLGYLFDPKELKASWTETERHGGTDITFYAGGNDWIERWLGNDDPEVVNRLCVFCETGGEASMGAFWLDDEGKQQIVHLGSGCGSDMVCILTDNMVDFLRLIAIGYEVICERDVFGEPSNSHVDEGDLFVHPNVAFQEWVKATFSVDIPRTASEIVKRTAGIDDEDSDEPFCRWCAEMSR